MQAFYAKQNIILAQRYNMFDCNRIKSISTSLSCVHNQNMVKENDKCSQKDVWQDVSMVSEDIKIIILHYERYQVRKGFSTSHI